MSPKNIFLKARIKLATVYTVIIMGIFFSGFLLNSWLDRILKENNVDPLMWASEAVVVVLVGLSSYYFAKRTLRPIEKSYESQQKFVADAAHELRTPLTVMKTGIETTLISKPSSEDFKTLLSETKEEINDMTNTVNDLLFLVNTNNRAQDTFQKLALDQLVKRQVSLMSNYATNKNISLKNNAAKQTWINGNPASLKRLMVNLLKNAIDYSKPRGSVNISLQCSKDLIVLRVQDTGIGMSSDDLSHIFERFYKADKSRTKQSSGAGLGLAIVKEIVDSHKAKIEIDSKLGQGTTVKIIFDRFS